MSVPLAVSMGEPAGIGPDVILDLYANRQARNLPVFAVFGQAGILQARAKRLGLDVAIAHAVRGDISGTFKSALPVFDTDGDGPDTPGEIQPSTARGVIAAIEQAVAGVRAGHFRGLVTAPIHKAALYGAGFRHPGHTEFLAQLCGADGQAYHPVMMLAHDDLRTVPLTIHIPLADVPGVITQDLIVDTVRIVAGDLSTRFAISAPRIAVAGLNPHAGEDGAIGREELEVIAPALDRLRAEGVDVSGPLPGDTLFYPPHWRGYDCVVAMYHDQALIPIKTVAFDAGVNVTLGLPIVRTSPDHGTALSIAGTGKASSNSMLAAIRLADAIS